MTAGATEEVVLLFRAITDDDPLAVNRVLAAGVSPDVADIAGQPALLFTGVAPPWAKFYGYTYTHAQPIRQ